MIGFGHDLRVMFDDDDRISQFTKIFEYVNQAGCISAVQSDRWLVQYVHGPDQAGAQASGQRNALRFASRQSGRETIQREIFKPDIMREICSVAGFRLILYQRFRALPD